MAGQKCNAAPAPQEGDKYPSIRHHGAQQRQTGDCRWLMEAVTLIDSRVDAAAHPEYPVEVLLVHSQEVAVVLPQDDGGGTR